jgi:hypothetical protein
MSRAKKKPARQDPNVYPSGWDYKRVAAVAAYYDARQDEDVLGDDALRPEQNQPVWVEVPKELLPKVRALIARHKNPA